MQQEITAILVDDEQSARDILGNLLENFCPSVELKGKFENVVEAVHAVKTYKPDLVFLDIEMPNYAGFEIINFFNEVDFEIIFVTAYDNYALKAFEVSALDYLLKPIDVDRLKEAVNKVRQKKSLQSSKEQFKLLSKTLKSKKISELTIFSDGYHQFVPLMDIVAIQAQEAYSKIHTKNGETFLVSNNLKHYERLLEDEENFFRTHKSWIININYLEKYSRSELLLKLKEGLSAKLSKYRKSEFERLINAF